MGRLLISKADLLFARKAEERAVIQIKAQADEFRAHGKRVNPPIRALVTVQIPNDDEFPKLIMRRAVEAYSRPAQFREAGKKQGSKIDCIPQGL